MPKWGSVLCALADSEVICGDIELKPVLISDPSLSKLQLPAARDHRNRWGKKGFADNEMKIPDPKQQNA